MKYRHTIQYEALIGGNLSDSIPAEYFVVRKIIIGQDWFELFPKQLIIWFGIELQAANIFEERDELWGQIMTKGVRRG